MFSGICLFNDFELLAAGAAFALLRCSVVHVQNYSGDSFAQSDPFADMLFKYFEFLRFTKR